MVDWKGRVVIDPGRVAGKPVINGTRIAVDFVIDLLACGWTVDEVLAEYDQLTSEDVRACLTYAAEAVKTRPLARTTNI